MREPEQTGQQKRSQVGDRRGVGNGFARTAEKYENPVKRHEGSCTSTLLAFLCGLCVILGIICICLTVLLAGTQRVEATSHFDPFRPEALTIMSGEPPSDLNFRLPKDVVPLHYDLYVHPDLENGTFQGRVTILIDVAEKRDYIALHQKDLNITSTKLRTYDREENHDVELKKVYNLENLEAVIVAAKDEIHSGLFNLTFEFNGHLRDKIVGFYSSKYRDAQNRTRNIATTKFEPTYARRAYPCFDEPSFKAEYTIKVVHPAGDHYGAISNMNIESIAVDQPSQGWTTVSFAKSVPMSSYLSCFIVSDFVAVTANAKGLNGRQFPVSVYTASERKEKGAFALDIGVKAIEHYIRLFDIDYPLPKLDMAAIPDFVSGAMENWGLVTYREARLLYDQQTSSTVNKEGIVTVIAHEFAHMWFGNLVTMAWWNDLWLNEGFASYMAYRTADAILPDWGFMDQFLIDELHPVLVTDAKLSSHPIVQTVNNPDEITALFDVITYNKGCSVLRMLENFVGPDTFYSAVSAYLRKHSYKNAETADLFAILQDSVGSRIDVSRIMDTWTRQMGYPVINVLRSNGSCVLTQKRFLADPEAKSNASESDFGYKWTIPVTYITDKSDVPTLVWFDKDEDNLTINLEEDVKWVKFNKGQIGYYRVNYAKADWENLVKVLQWSHKRFSVADRTHLLEDAFSLAEASELDYDVPLNITTYLSKETHMAPWSVAANKLAAIDALLASTNVIDKFRRYVRFAVDTPYHDVTWMVGSTEDHVTLILRTTILELACHVGHIECLEEAGAIFKKWINDPKDERPHPDIRSLVYYYGLSNSGGEAEWNAMFQKFNEESSAIEKLKLLRGLAGIRSSEILKRFINIAMDERHVRAQDALNCLRQIADNPVGTPLVWDWVRENWQVLVDRYTLNDRYLGQLIPAISATFATEVKLEEMREFFRKYPEAGAGATYRARALETVANNIKWVRRNTEKLEFWLDAHRMP